MTEVQSPLEPASDVPISPAENGAGSPSIVQQQEVALNLEWSRLSERLSQLKADEKAIAIGRRNALVLAAESRKGVVKERKEVLAQMNTAKRLLAAHKRLREPTRRKVAK